MEDYEKVEYTRWRIKGIIDTGSVYDKAKLFLKDRIGYFKMIGGKFILNYGEPEVLMDSVRPKDRIEWNKYLSYGLRLENGYKDLTRFATLIIERRNELFNTLTMMTEFEEMENLLNAVLTLRSMNESSDGNFIKKRNELASIGLRGTNLTLTKPTLLPDGSIDLNIGEIHPDSDENSGDLSLTDRANLKRERLRSAVRMFVCFSEALKRRVNESEIILPEYEMMICNLTELADESPCTLACRFEGRQDRRLGRIGHIEKKPNIFPLPSMADLIENYSVRPMDIDIAEEEDLIIKYYKSI